MYGSRNRTDPPRAVRAGLVGACSSLRRPPAGALPEGGWGVASILRVRFLPSLAPHVVLLSNFRPGMASPHSVQTDSLPHGTAGELDIYAAEFAKLVDRYPPTPSDVPADWLSRLPGEAFLYYHRGTATFGRGARTPIERRGRLYLIHTALVFMWMSWGKPTARDRFQSYAEKGTRRAASLVSLEHYRRAGVLADYNVFSWFFEPVGQWDLSLISAAARTDRVPDPEVQSALRERPVVHCSAETFAALRSAGALPRRDALVLG